MVVAAMATPLVLHPSISRGMMGMMFYLNVAPVIALALVAAAIVGGRLSTGPRRAVTAVAILLACGLWTLLRTDGVTGEGRSQFAWRWTPTSEQQLLAKPAVAELPPPAAAVPATQPNASQPTMPEKQTEAAPAPRLARRPPAEWPGFRGPQRDSRVSGIKIATDWTANPPVELWRRPVGPGWSSFAVGDGRLYTQEQRGDFEVVSCYNLETGEPVWAHRTPARFWESNAGAGPRGTPTLVDSRLYALGATGILTALDAATGSLIWTRNVATDTSVKVPEWGISSSPLVVGDTVVVAASGRLAAYEVATGKPRWYARSTKGSYSSPHLLTIDNVQQVVLLTGTGAMGVNPPDGKVLWQHEWTGTTMLQPAVAEGPDILITTGGASGGFGTRRLSIAHKADNWTAGEVWTSTGLKPYYNDLVVHDGHAYGFDGGILSCIDLKYGRRKWKGGRYGHGQMVLLADQGVLLVVSEEGELALVAASPDEYKELARRPALEGKTWNHPAVVGDKVLLRNGEEMAAFRLTRTDK
jgi:outer membrane protein assembly factor BamB